MQRTKAQRSKFNLNTGLPNGTQIDTVYWRGKFQTSILPRTDVDSRPADAKQKNPVRWQDEPRNADQWFVICRTDNEREARQRHVDLEFALLVVSGEV